MVSARGVGVVFPAGNSQTILGRDRPFPVPQREAFPALAGLTWEDKGPDLDLVEKCTQTFLRSPSDNCLVGAVYETWYSIASNRSGTPRRIK